MQKIEKKASFLIMQHMGALTSVYFPFNVTMDCINTCTIQGITYDAELLITRAVLTTRLNAIQEKLAKAVMGIAAIRPRAVLIHELGWKQRWGTDAYSEAHMLHQRAVNDLRYGAVARVLGLASMRPCTWTAAVGKHALQIGLPGIAQRFPMVRTQDKKKAAATFKQYRDAVLRPLVRRQEQEGWWRKEPQTQYMASHGQGRWTAVQLGSTGAPTCSG